MKHKGNPENFFSFWEIDNDNILEMDLTSIGCPVQFEGKLKDGTFFYFRERHDFAKFVIVKDKTNLYKANVKESLYYVSIPEAYFVDSAAEDINKWVNDYFKRKKEQGKFFNEGLNK